MKTVLKIIVVLTLSSFFITNGYAKSPQLTTSEAEEVFENLFNRCCAHELQRYKIIDVQTGRWDEVTFRVDFYKKGVGLFASSGNVDDCIMSIEVRKGSNGNIEWKEGIRVDCFNSVWTSCDN